MSEAELRAFVGELVGALTDAFGSPTIKVTDLVGTSTVSWERTYRVSRTGLTRVMVSSRMRTAGVYGLRSVGKEKMS